MVTLCETTMMAVLWLTGTFRNIKTTVCELMHLTWGSNEDNHRWDCLVDSDWRRLLLNKAWETPKQALQLVTCLSRPDLPGPVLLQSESSAAIAARHSSPQRLVQQNVVQISEHALHMKNGISEWYSRSFQVGFIYKM